MEDDKTSSTSKFEPIVNKEILYDIEISNAKRKSWWDEFFFFF